VLLQTLQVVQVRVLRVLRGVEVYASDGVFDACYIHSALLDRDERGAREPLFVALYVSICTFIPVKLVN
jgi:hypothetical protein